MYELEITLAIITILIGIPGCVKAIKDLRTKK